MRCYHYAIDRVEGGTWRMEGTWRIVAWTKGSDVTSARPIAYFLTETDARKYLLQRCV
jgi:hypothetical protein